MVWLTNCEKFSEDMITRFDRIHEHDGQTDGQRPHNSIRYACIQHRAAKTIHGLSPK